MTIFFTTSSFRTALLFIPPNNPASMNGIKSSACHNISKLRIPNVVYRIILIVFSIQNTIQILALNALLLSVTRFTYAASNAPTPYSPHNIPDATPEKHLKSNCNHCYSESSFGKTGICIFQQQHSGDAPCCNN